MTQKEIATKRAKNAADKIFRDWQIGHLCREHAHDKLNRLNGVLFDAYDFGLMVIDPGETQEYIHSLQDKMSE